MREIFFFKNHAENKAGELVPDLLFFKKALHEVKTSRTNFCSPRLEHTIKKLYTISDC